MQIGEAQKTDVGMVRAWLANSRHRKDWAVRRCCRTTMLKDKPSATIAVLGLAYKENTHSTKNSPSLALLAHLRGNAGQGRTIRWCPRRVAPWTTGAADPLGRGGRRRCADDSRLPGRNIATSRRAISRGR